MEMQSFGKNSDNRIDLYNLAYYFFRHSRIENLIPHNSCTFPRLPINNYISKNLEN